MSFDQSDLVGEGYIKFRINNFKAFQDAEKSSSPQFKLAGKKWYFFFFFFFLMFHWYVYIKLKWNKTIKGKSLSV